MEFLRNRVRDLVDISKTNEYTRFRGGKKEKTIKLIVIRGKSTWSMKDLNLNINMAYLIVARINGK